MTDTYAGFEPEGVIAHVGDEEGIEKYQQVRDGLTKLLYYGGKDVPVSRALQLLNLIEPFESAIIKHGPGLVKNAAGASVSNDEYNDAHKCRWWRTTGLPAMKPTDTIPSGKYALEIYAPALNVINAGAFLKYATPTAIERVYMLMGPLAKEIADLPAGLVAGAREQVVRIIHETAKLPGEAAGAAASGLGVAGMLMVGGGVLAAILLLKR